MARINDLIRQLEAKDPALANEISREMRALSERRAFGLNFERHTPEQVELPGRPVRKGDKVNILPPRGEFPNKENKRIWLVDSISTGKKKVANLIAQDDLDETCEVPFEDLVVVAEFRDPIYPGLVSTGKVERGGDKPFHTVINGENFHALEALLFTHRGKVDAIYIDPPYNTGARDWKYNNDYVEADDLYRHSKWLAFMERRLLLAKQLLNPEDSMLIVTIDEKEHLRLGLLLEQTFQGSTVQMVSSVINPVGSGRTSEFSRLDEYIFFVLVGNAAVPSVNLNMLGKKSKPQSDGEVRWTSLNREGSGWERSARPKLFYPLYVDLVTLKVIEVGEPLPLGFSTASVENRPNCQTVWPMKGSDESRWQVGPETCRALVQQGLLTVRKLVPERSTAIVRYLTSGSQEKIRRGVYKVDGIRSDGSKLVFTGDQLHERPGTVWNLSSHSARDFGTSLLSKFLPGRRFPFPKSLYAVEDALRFATLDKKTGIVLDFFSGSGSTAHAVMRLNRQDGGTRQSISVTNNEVSADEHRKLIEKGVRRGDPEWERLGICDFITKPRIEAVVTGVTPDNNPIAGEYKFTDEFPMADGFEENVEFFTLTYESPLQVASGRAFERITPLLWLRAGSSGRRIESVESGWDVADSYGVLTDLDKSEEFASAISKSTSVTHAYVFTDEDRLFEVVARQIPNHVEVVRMNDAYIRNAEIEAPAVAR